MKALAVSTAAVVLSSAAAQQGAVRFDGLKEGERIDGFRAAAVYLNGEDKPMGARFVHLKSGFTLDVLEIQSAPQGFIWTTTYPTSNMGEPHTQEHLLLGKGDKGRAVANAEPMALASSTAFTMQWRTCYSFYTPAGADVFFDQTEGRLDAMLHPDYTDEEIRREVRNFGVAENPDRSLRLEEKGTVYNEMVSTMDQPNARIYRESGVMIYGPEHPLSYNSGGSPEALRVMQPSDIRKFHRDNYHLSNMGMLASLPKDVPLAAVLQRFDAMLNRLEPRNPGLPVKTERDLPRPQPVPRGEIRIVEYPHRNSQQPGTAMFWWPAERTGMTRVEEELLDLFLAGFAGDPATNLYKRFIDSRTREADIGAKSVGARADEDLGHPVVVAFGDLPASKMNERDLADLRAKVMDELNRIAAWKPGSAELEDFNRRLRSELQQTRRTLLKFVNSPPRFGFRMANAGWMQQLDRLNREPGFRKSVTLKPELAEVEKLLAEKRNIWTDYLAKWKLTGVEPWALGSRANPALIEKGASERAARIRTEVERLERQYGVSDPQQAIRRYRAEYDANTAELERKAAAAAPAKFMEHPPLTLDDQLDFTVMKLAGGVPLTASTFDGMAGATAGIALRLDGVPESRYPELALLPALLTRVGVIENGRAVSFEEMSERLKNEILALSASFSTNPYTGRVELMLRGSGNDTAEARRALEWMRLALYSPDWRAENLARIRDVVDQSLSGLRRGMQRPEEIWVDGPANALWRQDKPLLALAGSFLTQSHEALRLRWMLMEASPGERTEAAKFLDGLAGKQGSREERRKLLAGIAAGKPSKLAVEAAKDLEAALPDIPDSSLEADWRYLCRRMRADLLAGPEQALAALDEVRRSILKTGGARMFVVSSAAARKDLERGIAELVKGLAAAPAAKPAASGRRLVADRLRERDASAVNPVYMGLLNPNSQGGVFLLSAPLAGYRDTDRDKLLDYLAAELYGGHGAHGLFMKTWAAGLAYSNGVRVRPANGRLNYYAERTPELPQTMKFVVDELKKAPAPDQGLVEYAIAEAFSATRAASTYETRAEAMADDLADGLTPEVVSRFRKSILELRKMPGLGEELGRRMNRVYGTVLPGLSGKTAGVKGAVYLTIGPEKQLAAWEDYLRTVEGPETKLYRLYPRDFWIAAE